MKKGNSKAERAVTEQKGRLTTGDAPLHVRRAALANPIADCAHMIRTMLDNWPAEFQLGQDHRIYQALYEMDMVAEDLVEPPPAEEFDDEDLI